MIVLCIIDGWGLGTDDDTNAIYLANTPNIDQLLANYPQTKIGAAGEYIGLTPGHQGSSEMGHMIIGAGRNVLLPQTQVTQEDYSKNQIFQEALKKSNRIHLIGLCSDKGVHSYLKTGLEFQDLALAQGKQVYWHVFADGRDAPPKSVKQFIKDIKSPATLMGRWWAMDRDQNWDRIAKAYTTLTQGQAFYNYPTLTEAIDAAYQRGETDELIKPTLINPEGLIKPGDVVINFNYRVDRAIEISKAFTDPDFSAFPRPADWNKVHYVALTKYCDDLNCQIMLKQARPKKILGEVLADRDYKQFRLAETEKWAYITKCFNAMREEPFNQEERFLIPSDKVATFDLKPEMQALPLAEKLAEIINQNKHDVAIINLANPDMVGHTGNQPAIIKACETVDQAMGIIYKACQKNKAKLLICSDHGDAECNLDHCTGQPHTSHTDNFVPFILVDEEHKQAKLREDGSLKDIAPTLLYLLGETPPPEMTGKNLII